MRSNSVRAIAILPIFLFGIGAHLSVFATTAASSFSTAADLTDEERQFVRKSPPVKLCVDPDWEPFEKLDADGNYSGIGADIAKTVFERVGLKYEIHKTGLWDESVEASKEGKCEVLSFLNQTPARDEWLVFTAPTFFDPNVVITREGHPFIPDLAGLQYESVAVPSGTSIEEWVRKEYPNLLVIPTKSEKEAIDMVSERKADMTIRSLIIAAYTIKKEGLFNLKISGQFSGHENRLRMGVRKESPMLRQILDKGVATLTQSDRDAISNRHVPITVQRGTDTALIVKILAAVALILAAGLYWNRKLSALNRELERLSVTDRLTGLANRLKLDAKLEEEIERSERFGTPFSVILGDIDHFKLVNDRFGHQAGDTVLKGVADALVANTRKTDVVGRWGGEEFLILCPQTDLEGAVRLANALKSAVESADFGKVGKKTASFGVAEFRKGDRMRELVCRSDAALYRAKESGRNRVERE